MKASKTKILCILTAVIVLITALPITAFAADIPSPHMAEHIHGDQCDHAETNTTIPTPGEGLIFLCIIGQHSMKLISSTPVDSGGSGYDYCDSVTLVEVYQCLYCHEVETTTTLTTEPHQWSVGWCGQTCTKCGIVEMFHEDGGCWYCS